MQLRLGVLSTARIGVGKVIPATLAAGSCTVTAIASRDLARAREAAARFGIPHAYGSYGDLVASTEVDAVYVPLPNHLHAEWTVAAAEAGKHVLCEKPLAMDADEARRMVAACDAAGVVLVEAFMYRFHPQWARVQELLDDGALGTVQAVHTAFGYHNRDPRDIRNIAAYGGGALMDVGCYGVDTARWLLGGEPEAVTGAVHVDPELGTDVLASGVLTFPGGRQATLTCGTQFARAQWVRILGSEGGLLVETPFDVDPSRPTRLVRYRAARDEAPEVVEIAPSDHYTLQAEAFARAVLHGERPARPAEEGVATLEVVDALRRP